MDTGVIIAIAIPVLIVLAAAVAITTARRRDQAGLGHLSAETKARDEAVQVALGEEASLRGRHYEQQAASGEPAGGGALATIEDTRAVEPWTPPDPEALGVTRRQFLNRSMVLLTLLGTAGFGATVLAFLWPTPRGGFGSKVNVGSVEDVQAAIAEGTGSGVPNFAYFSAAKSYITPYPADALDAGRAVYDPEIFAGMEEFGMTALYQKCPHLGCKVPACDSSQWFECPCHGSKYNRVGEKRAGPAPRGLDRFVLEVSDGDVLIDTGIAYLGPPIGTDTTAQGAEGPPCTSGGGH
jgi:cytochrome b6-f complex iron-sulfur subunit